MRNYLAILFGMLTLLSVVIWMVGALTAAVLPWFGGIRADHLGQIGAAIFFSGDVFVECFGRLTRHFLENQKAQTIGFPGPKKYGNKKHIISYRVASKADYSPANTKIQTFEI
jgi:hypothetical protein